MPTYNNSVANAYFELIHKHIDSDCGDRVAVIHDSATYSYRDIEIGAIAVFERLAEMGVMPEQRVALLIDDSPEFVYWLLGTLRYGAIPVPLNTFADGELLRFFLDDSRSRLLVAHAKYRDSVLAARNMSAADIAQVVWVEDECYTQSHKTRPKVFPAHSDDAGLWLYTSGSTARPKAVIHRHVNLTNVCQNYGKHVLGIHADDVTYSTSKLFFAYGLGNSLLFPFYVGAASILVSGKAAAGVVCDILKKHRPSLFFSVPALYNLLAEHVECTPELTQGVRLCVSAGENLPVAVLDKWKRRTGLEIIDGIGSTEATHIFCSNLPNAVVPGASGSPVPGYELKIVNDQGYPVDQGDVGHLMVKGDSIAKGFWNRHELTQSTFCGEWLSTGDLYRQGDAGQYIYMGRDGDVFKVSGQWVSPVEIEQLLLLHDDVAEAAVIADRDASGLSRARAFVVATDAATQRDDDGFVEEIRVYLSNRLPKYKVPSVITSIDKLPKTATGKVARGSLRQLEIVVAVNQD